MADRAARVLVVDDDPYVRDILQRFLEQRGFEVSISKDGRHAVKTIESFRPDVVLLDIRMPNMNGIECLQKIVASDVRCGVIMISGEADIDLARDTLKMGAVDFIYKPFDLEYLETSLLAKLLLLEKS